MEDTLARHITMLSLIPRQPQKISTERIRQFLEDRGYDVTLRSIQRDLRKLQLQFPIQGDDARPQGWSWLSAAPAFSLPALDPQTALTLHMVEQYMKQLLPVTTLSHLQPWFAAAESLLSAAGHGLHDWPNKIRVLPQGLPRIPPQIDANIHATISEALFSDRQLKATYRSCSADQSWTKVLNPLGLVVRNGTIYLVCTIEEQSELRQLPLQRMESVVVLDNPVLRPEKFDLDQAIAEGTFGIQYAAKPIKLEAYFSSHVAQYLAESPIAEDQAIGKDEDGEVRFTATIPDTFELRQWLKSFGDEVVVTKPVTLRAEFKDIANSLAAYYQD